MLSVALTGNAASGKSTVAGLFEDWGATVISADAIVRELQAPGTPLLDAIVADFGPGILQPDGSLDRIALRHRIFSDEEARMRLNALVHPAVETERQHRTREAAAAGADVVVTEVPLLFETGLDAQFDVIVLVESPRAHRLARLRARGLDDGIAEGLLRAQDASPGRARASHHVIVNDGSLAHLRMAARRVWEALVDAA